jgi:hypothetical protein
MASSNFFLREIILSKCFQILSLLFLSDYKFLLHLFELLKIEIPYEEIASKLKEY